MLSLYVITSLSLSLAYQVHPGMPYTLSIPCGESFIVPVITTANARDIVRLRRRSGRQTSKTQLLDMQARLLRDVLDPATKPTDAAMCARAFDVLEERLRILKGKPLPGQLRPDLRLEQKPKRIPPTFSSLEAIDVTETPKESLSLLPEGPGTPPPGGTVGTASSV